MNENLEYLRMFARFPFALRRFLKDPLTLGEARRIVRERLDHREDNFLRIAEQAIYANPKSPYRALLRHAGCENGDLRTLVKSDGLDDALRHLRRAGVYVTYQEFKGRTPIVRGSTTIQVTASDFDNQSTTAHFTLSTGASTGLSTSVHHDLSYISATAPLHLLMLHAWNAVDLPAVHWMRILPSAGLRFMLTRARLARYPEHWFSNFGWFDTKTWFKYDLATLYIIGWLRAYGVPVPIPTIVKLDQALTVARAVRDTLDRHGHCLLYCNVSCALRVSVAAEEAGFDLAGTTIRVGGEPVTPAKVATMRRVGARVLPAYGAIETGQIGLGCPNAVEVDQVHLAHDSVALITHPYVIEGTGLTVPAFNLTSLIDASPKVMLNYQIDDYGTVETRACGCPLGECGYTTHLSGIRSYSKLLCEGVTFLGSEVLHVLEEVLPGRYGGSPLDYQLMEEEDSRGLTRLHLVISPRLHIPDEQEPARVLLQALRASSPRGDSAGNVWQQADTLRVRRQEPVSTARGKLLPLHSRRTPPHA